MANETKISEHEIAVKFRGKWPPDFSKFSRLGFDSVKVSRGSAVLRKVHGSDMGGRAHLFTEIEVGRNRIALRYACPPGSDEGARRLSATLLLLYVMRAVPGMDAELQPLSEALLPPMEKATAVLSEPYERLLKRCADLQADLVSAAKANRRLLAHSEESAHASLEAERQIAALSARVRKLESVPDGVLSELILEWLAAHRGSFSVPQFCSAHGIAPARCEEGLERLLKEGGIRRVPNGFSHQAPQAPRVFEPAAARPASVQKLLFLFGKK